MIYVEERKVDQILFCMPIKTPLSVWVPHRVPACEAYHAGMKTWYA